MKLSCRFGLHEWSKWSDVTPTKFDGSVIEYQGQTRVCSACGIVKARIVKALTATGEVKVSK